MVRRGWLVVSVAVLLMLLGSCGSGGTLSGGESGLGGTGITLVKGNIASIEGASVGHATEIKTNLLATINAFIQPAYAQTGSLRGIAVAGGGRITFTNENGGFVLEDVEPSENFVITLTNFSGPQTVLDIGRVAEAEVVNIRNIRIDLDLGTTEFESIEATPSTGSAEDFAVPNVPPTPVSEPMAEELDQQGDDQDNPDEDTDSEGSGSDDDDDSDSGSGGSGDGAESDPDAGGGGGSGDGSVGDDGNDSTL